MTEYNKLIEKIYIFAFELKNYANTLIKYDKVNDLANLAEKLGYTIRLSYGKDVFMDDELEDDEQVENKDVEFEFFEDDVELQKIKERRNKIMEETKNIGLDFTNDTSKVVYDSFDFDIKDSDEDIVIGSDEEESDEESEESEEEVPITRKRTIKLKYDFE